MQATQCSNGESFHGGGGGGCWRVIDRVDTFLRFPSRSESFSILSLPLGLFLCRSSQKRLSRRNSPRRCCLFLFFTPLFLSSLFVLFSHLISLFVEYFARAEAPLTEVLTGEMNRVDFPSVEFYRFSLTRLNTVSA